MSGCRYFGCGLSTTEAGLCAEHRGAWRDLAACAGSDLAVWFARDPASVASCRDTCHGCPVRAACLVDALAAEVGLTASNRHGTRAGLTPAERVAAERRERRTMGSVTPGLAAPA